MSDPSLILWSNGSGLRAAQHDKNSVYAMARRATAARQLIDRRRVHAADGEAPHAHGKGACLDATLPESLNAHLDGNAGAQPLARSDQLIGDLRVVEVPHSAHAGLPEASYQFLPSTKSIARTGPIPTFRSVGTEVTGEIVDNRQEHMNAFAMVREGMAFLERTMPLGARSPTGEIFREDRFPVPLDALREIMLNAVMHRDYSHHAG